ncbi:MAG TPA: hypothetical protein VKS60_13855, partial [Stellaceae bacterium]|nr:hypothetical protein [Stellaceae bacterium]
MSEPATAPESDQDRTERHLAMLRRIGEIGMALLETVQQQAESETPPEPAALAGAFARLSRAVRQTIALESKLVEERRSREAQAAHTGGWSHLQDAVERQRKAQQAAKVRARVARAIEWEADSDAAEDLLA